MCTCLQGYQDVGDQKLMEAARVNCPRSFASDTLVAVLGRAVVANEIKFEGGKTEYNKLEQGLLAKARDNTIISLLDNCPMYKKALVALRESTATDFNQTFPITKKYNAKTISQSLTDESPRNRSTSLLGIGAVYEQQGDYTRAMSFYQEAYAVSSRYRIKGFMHLLKDKVDAAPLSSTSPSSRDLIQVQKEADEAFTQHHCDCLSEFQNGPIDELLEAYNLKCYERFLLKDFRKITAGISDPEAPSKTTNDIQKEIATRMLSNTAVALVNNCAAYRKVVSYTMDLDQEKIEFVQKSFSHDPSVLKQEVSSAAATDQAAAFKFMGIYEEKQKNYQTAMKLYELSYEADPKSRLLAYMRLLEMKIASGK
ncbi:MAG: hypothetical protein Roseis2KO_53310 [Roseivirga sp.]